MEKSLHVKSSMYEGIRGKFVDIREFCDEVSGICQSVNYRKWLTDTCSVHNVLKKFPIIKWIPKYRCEYAQGDIIAGVTVALTVIPASLAYAQIAQLSPEYGLYTSFMASFIYVLFGTSKELTLGPTVVMALLTATFATSPVEQDASFAIILTLVSGLVQLLMAFLSLGFLLHFISYPVINAFATAASITITVGQLKKVLGLKNIPRQFFPQVIELCRKLPETKLPDFGMGVAVIIILAILKRLKQKKFDLEKAPIAKVIAVKMLFYFTIARNAIVIAIAGGIAAAVNTDDVTPFTLTGNITGGLPDFKFPQFHLQVDNATTYGPMEMLSYIGEGLLIVPIIGVVESIAIANTYARQHNYKIDFNQELLANGACNLLGSFVGSYPVSGSFGRTALSNQSGVRTPLSGLITGGLVLVALATLTPLFYYIPSPALAGVIIVAMQDSANFSLLKQLWRIKKLDLIPWFVTFIFSFILGVEYGIIIGIAVSLLFLLYPWARPRVQEEGKDICVVKIDQGLRFPGAEFVMEKIKKIAEGRMVRSIILDCLYLSDLDYSAVQSIQSLCVDLRVKNILLVVARPRPPVLELLQCANIDGLHCFDTVEKAAQYVKDTKPGAMSAGEKLWTDGSEITHV